MSSKISALAAATSWATVDITTGVQGGVNKKITRDFFLQASGADTVALTGSAAGEMGVTFDGEIFLSTLAGKSITMQWNLNDFLTVSIAGLTTMSAQAGEALILAGNGATIRIEAAGGIGLFPAGGQVVDMVYIAGAGGSWAGASPGDVYAALDRIAAAVAGILGAPIP